MSHWSKSKCVGFLTSWGIEWRTNYHHRTHIDWSGRTGRLKIPQYHPILRVWNALNPVWKSCVCMMPDINCAKRGTPTMRCAFHRLTPRLSNAVPTVGTRLYFWHLGRAKFQPLRNFWPQIDLSPPHFPNFEDHAQSLSQNLRRAQQHPARVCDCKQKVLALQRWIKHINWTDGSLYRGSRKLSSHWIYALGLHFESEKCKPWA